MEVVDLSMVKVQPLRKVSVLDCSNGHKHVPRGFEGRNEGNIARAEVDGRVKGATVTREFT